MLILLAVASCAHEPHQRNEVAAWLKQENLWPHTSPNEQHFFTEKTVHEETCMELSWQAEGALVLGWALQKVSQLPTLDGQDDRHQEKAFEELQENLPPIGGETKYFLLNLEYRDLEEVYIENLVNEAATGYFRDLMFNQSKDKTNIDRGVSHERHIALNWLRSPLDSSEWDDTDTST